MEISVRKRHKKPFELSVLTATVVVSVSVLLVRAVLPYFIAMMLWLFDSRKALEMPVTENMLSIALEYVSFLVPAYVVIRWKKFVLRDRFNQFFGLKKFPLIVPVIVCCFVFGQVTVFGRITEFFHYLMPALDHLSRWRYDEIMAGGVPLASYLCFSVIAAPLIEELYFRGFILKGLLNKYGPAFGVTLSAFLFAASHLRITGFVELFAIGVILGLAYHFTRSVWPGILGHAVNNLLSALYFIRNPKPYDEIIRSYATPDLRFGTFDIYCGAALLVGTGLFLLYLKMRRKKEAVPIAVADDKPDEGGTQ